MRKGYALAAALVVAIEVGIALFVHDGVVRPFVGDALAVALVYLCLRAAIPISVVAACMTASGIAAVIEFGQLFHLLQGLGLDHNRVARVVLGGTFDFKDFAAYAAGAGGVTLWETLRRRGTGLKI